MKRCSRRSTFLSACLAVLAAGCGGGGQSGSPAAVSRTSKIGEAVLTYFGQPKPQLTSGSGSVGVVGQAGATFSAVTLEPPPNLADTYLAISRQTDSTTSLYKLPYGSASPQLLYQNNQSPVYPGCSAYGSIAFSFVFGGLYTVRTDGTGLRQLSFTGASGPTCPQYSVDGTNRICFVANSGGLYVAPGTGGTPTLLQDSDTGYPGAWNPAGTLIAYSAVSGSAYQMMTTSTTSSGTTPNNITPTGFAGQFLETAWNADGQTIAVSLIPSGDSTAEIVKYQVSNLSNAVDLTPSGFTDTNPAFSPDGSMLAFDRRDSGGATPGVYISDAAGANPVLVLPDTSLTNSTGGISWSPFLPKETVVAASGSTFFHEACSGFLLSQVGSQFGSFVAFTANTPADAAIQAPAASTGSQPMLFTLTADSITEIGYTNNYFSPGTIVTLSSTPSVVISIDPSTGQVDLMAPAATPKASPTKNADGTMTYNCEFKAIYDGTGKNLAPSGAHQLVVNSKTGKMVSFS